MAAELSGHNYGPPALDPAGYSYVSFVTCYTALLLAGLILLIHYRNVPSVRLRGALTTCVSVLLIHVYLAAIFIVYPLNGWYTCGEEFWYMNIVFPIAIAFYQASNTRLLSVFNLQADASIRRQWARKTAQFGTSPDKFIPWFRSLTYEEKTYLGVALGTLVQLALTFFLFYGSRRFSPRTGIFGYEVDSSECRLGFEWIPSVLWQFLWCYVLGPLVLFKSRRISDTHYWALQIRLSILAGLPGTPLWLAFLYSKNSFIVHHVNPWWPPVAWFAPGLITMQIGSIIFPLYGVYKYQAFKRSSKHCYTIPGTPDSVDYRDEPWSSDPKDLACNLKGFYFYFDNHIDLLASFAAKRDFTAENVEFLRRVREFKSAWDSGARAKLYEDAAHIFFELVHPSTSIMSINIDDNLLGKLKKLFEGLAYEPPRRQDLMTLHGRRLERRLAAAEESIAPWSEPAGGLSESAEALQLSTPTQIRPRSHDSKGSRQTIRVYYARTEEGQPLRNLRNIPDPRSSGIEVRQLDAADGLEQSKGRLRCKTTGSFPWSESMQVPADFGVGVFDAAEAAVKYLVFTNTWKNYIAACDEHTLASMSQTLQDSFDAVSSGDGNSVETTGWHEEADKSTSRME